MIIWRGRGILVLLIWGIALGVSQALFDGMVGKGYYEDHAWPKIMTGLIAAAPIWFLGKKWNESGERTHDLFFIPMQYWAPLALIFSIIIGAPVKTDRPTPTAVIASNTETPAARPVVASMIPPPAASPAPQPITESAPAPPPKRMIKQVYALNETHLYYPEDCANRPAKAYRIGRSVALAQGFALAPGCKE